MKYFFLVRQTLYILRANDNMRTRGKKLGPKWHSWQNKTITKMDEFREQHARWHALENGTLLIPFKVHQESIKQNTNSIPKLTSLLTPLQLIFKQEK